ncbi:MAG: c-type cytochrome [Alphaproteobacteria bacterium]|nr:c-type cytochrome [Alphaproteobacteria bacterium]
MRTSLSFLLSRLVIAAMAFGLLAPVSVGAYAAERKDESYHADYIFGAPADPSEAWIMSRGGRLYDNWFNTQGIDKPKETHPAWPASNTKKKGDVTWRCKSCHGWDYLGADGKYASGSYKTGIPGILSFGGKDVGAVTAAIRGGPHGFTKTMIDDEQMAYLAAFVSRGLDDMNKYIDAKSGDVKGDPKKGAAVFQTNCAACHGFDGRALNWGDEKEPAYIGTEANANPWEILHKIRNGHPGVEMVSLRAFEIQTAVDVLAYSKTLPVK